MCTGTKLLDKLAPLPYDTIESGGLVRPSSTAFRPRRRDGVERPGSAFANEHGRSFVERLSDGPTVNAKGARDDDRKVK